MLFEFFADQSRVILTIRHFLEPLRAATTPRNSLVWQKLSDGLVFFIARGESVRILFDSKHAAHVTLGVAHARRHIALARKCNELVLR